MKINFFRNTVAGSAFSVATFLVVTNASAQIFTESFDYGSTGQLEALSSPGSFTTWTDNNGGDAWEVTNKTLGGHR